MNRQPVGIPVGGQFAADRKDEPMTSLVPGGGQFGVPAEEEAPKLLEVNGAGNLSSDDRARLEEDANTLAKEGLRGRIRSATHASYQQGEDGLVWTSPSENKIVIHGLGLEDRTIADGRDTFNSGALRFPSMQDYDPDDNSTPSLVRMAQDMDRKLNIARAWEATSGFKPLGSTRVKGVDIDLNGDVNFKGETSAGTVFEIRHSLNSAESRGYYITAGGLIETEMDGEDVEMYQGRLVGRRLGAIGGERPNGVINSLCKDLRWNFRNLNDDK